MTIRVALNHKTEYRYDRPVILQPHVVRLRPAPHCRTPILSYSLNVRPVKHFCNWQQDPYSNYLARLVFEEPTQEFAVEVDLVAELTALNPFDFFIDSCAENYPFAYEDVLARELIPYLETLPAGPQLEALIAQCRRDKIRTVDYVVELNSRLQQVVKYVIRLEPGVQTCEETLLLGSGSCRDTAWLLVQLLRHLGLAARFVSGYLIQLTADVKALKGPAGPEKDFADLHAWAEVYLPGAGWIGLDPTSGLLAGEGHIPLACAADPISAAAVTGSFAYAGDPSRGPDDKVHEDFHFQMTVTRIHESPRVTLPYSEGQWQNIDALGRQVDGLLRAGDVRLTMGGEPTFVSIDDRDGDEWNTLALGPDKRQRAGMLLRKLRDRFASGGLLHFGEGKWYPGEALPRWSLGCYWRRDGVAVWQDPALIADDEKDYGCGEAEAKRFIRELAVRLDVEAQNCIPAFEDLWYYLWKEDKLPVNVDALDSKLENAEERKRLARLFEQGLGKVVGYALPLRSVDDVTNHWQSGKWFFRRERMYLIPGDSPMGLRLPMDSLPWAPVEEREVFYELDPTAPRGTLPPRPGDFGQHRVPPDEYGPMSPPDRNGGLEHFRNGRMGREDNGRTGGNGSDAPLSRASVGNYANPSRLVRTALCVEPRHGRLHVFMPPLRLLEDYLELVAAVEATSAAQGLPVLIEGYPPPHDHRMNYFKLTPDPGVLEVNIQPAGSWPELVENTNILYEEARQTGLSTEKFLIDGRHIGTGGGNHIVLGGPTAAESPFLRRPDLLRSLLGYWHNHPSLSYLFSGMFVGPTTQAPRVDEARNDSLYELELAFRRLPDGPGKKTPWLVDRSLRHLLIDVTGNTHRAEFCIDKLFSPDSSSGRLGLLELRAFEMPPHARMSLVQQLLLRALVARFWRSPYTQQLARWGTELHDRFMLPHFIRQDFDDVLYELGQAGFAFDEAWFAPHFEFRFPTYGSVARRGVNMELRLALEPWHVLGEESAGGATVRYVDSSVERLQVKVSGMTDTRHVVTCNGRRLPLHPTGVNGEFVAGVRYRAWQPASCLHPTIPVHAPLTFDILDTWLGRSMGGCVYHVSHAGGRSHVTRPINASEAEGRRTARFFPFGHTPGPITVRSEAYSPECPLTLDLRQPAARATPAGAGMAPGVEAMGGNELKLDNRPPANALNRVGV
jgi:uncharacterized protein (DUF2126 family)/transglutaminase-like putative cysteine protease